MSDKNLQHRPPSLASVARAVGWVTFQEVIRDKILYNIILCTFLLLGLGFLASKMTFSRPERVIMDFGLSAVAISCTLIAIFTGASLLGREFDRRTIYVALSHPISRTQFVLGKFAGLAGVLALNWVLLSVSYLALLLLAGGAEVAFQPTLLAALVLAFFQSLMIGSLAILFSTVSTTSLAVIITIGLYLVGNNISEIRMLAARIQSPAGKMSLNFVSTLLPNLEYFRLGNQVTYGFPVTPGFVLTAMSYSVVVSCFLLLAAGFLIRGREV